MEEAVSPSQGYWKPEVSPFLCEGLTLSQAHRTGLLNSPTWWVERTTAWSQLSATSVENVRFYLLPFIHQFIFASSLPSFLLLWTLLTTLTFGLQRGQWPALGNSRQLQAGRISTISAALCILYVAGTGDRSLLLGNYYSEPGALEYLAWCSSLLSPPHAFRASAVWPCLPVSSDSILSLALIGTSQHLDTRCNHICAQTWLHFSPFLLPLL